MKPVKLTLSGLNSFRQKQEIDFGVLTEAGVFGIFGKTGSGKSTLLDAITLALYGEVLRAKGGTQGIVNHGEKSVDVAFTFELGLAQERQRYRVERRYVRVDENAVRNSVSRLVLMAPTKEEEVIKEGSREVTRAIAHLLGMTCDDFTRAVVLPQGRFAQFLNLGGRERREMLQRLFKLEQFGRILGEKTNKRYQSVYEEKGKVESELKGIGDASEEALQQVIEALTKATEEEKKSKEALQQVQKKWQEFQKRYELQEKIAVVEKKYDDHQKQIDLLEKIKEAVHKAERASKVYPFLQRQEEVHQYEQSLLNEKSVIEKEVQNLWKRVLEAQKTWEEAKKRREEEEAPLIREKAQLEEALKIEKRLALQLAEIESLLEELSVYQQEVEKASLLKKHWREQRTINQIDLSKAEEQLVLNRVESSARNAVIESCRRWDNLEQKRKIIAKAETEVKGREKKLEESRGHWTQKGILADNLHKEWEKRKAQEEKLADPPIQERIITDFEIRLGEMALLHKSLQEQENAWKQLNEEQKKNQETVGTLGQEKGKEEAKLQKATAALVALQEKLEQLLRQDKIAMAIQLAQDLQPGQPCLVCGSLDHRQHSRPTEQDSSTKEEKELLERKIAETEKAQEKIKKNLEQIERSIDRAETIKDFSKEKEGILREELRHLRRLCNQKWPGKKPLELSLEENSPSALLMEKRIEGARQALSNKKVQLQQWKEEREKSQKRLQHCYEQRAKAQADYETGEELVRTAEIELDKAREKNLEALQEGEKAEEWFRHSLLSLSLPQEMTLDEAQEKIKKMVAEIEEKDRLYAATEKAIATLHEAIAQSIEKYEEYRQEEIKAHQEVIQREALLKEKKEQRESQEKQLHQITEGVSATELLRKNEKKAGYDSCRRKAIL
ncbi:AAA family ATPase [Heliorestis convoluta]|uniref:Nuclease SbcCD subunit C n=1 Tax=Heliorestis convoluta TaxID=356322 RepID=A0A5Q2N407_9FIRM|nr:ATP-binding protein [Heliorestis convoluta]QGG48619.1 AAA family ATPase, putative [Heliorestis convoluta]